jgi:putative ABC transport system substrate-binding protein
MMPLLDSLRQGLEALGWIDGRDLVIEARWAEGRQERLAALATELSALGVDVLVSQATPASVAAKAATSTIPIVAVSISDPVGSGLVESVARPGGNVTGLGLNPPELGAKRLQILKEAVPPVSRVAVMWNPDNPVDAAALAATREAATSLGVALQPVPVRAIHEIEGALERAAAWRPDGLSFMASAVTVCCNEQLVTFASRHRLPAIYETRGAVDGGGLMSYAGSSFANYRHAAVLVDKILRGAKPTDLPIEQPATFDFIINLKSAQSLGLSISQSVLVQATELIQ